MLTEMRLNRMRICRATVVFLKKCNKIEAFIMKSKLMGEQHCSLFSKMVHILVNGSPQQLENKYSAKVQQLKSNTYFRQSNAVN